MESVQFSTIDPDDGIWWGRVRAAGFETIEQRHLIKKIKKRKTKKKKKNNIEIFKLTAAARSRFHIHVTFYHDFITSSTWKAIS